MKMVELHIIQSFPVTCLNRDDVGAPKSAIFGGIQRARVSSQCWKRAIRGLAAEMLPGSFAGRRSHYMAAKLQESLVKEGLEEEKARKAAETIAEFIGKRDAKYKEGFKTSVALYLSPGELGAIAKAAADDICERKQVNVKTGSLEKAIASSHPVDLADIAIFGRMVASDHTLMVEGAGLFSHALSTHKVSNEIDFFSAVDDLKPEESEGAGHIGTLEFNSACYYRYIGLNIDLLADSKHLARFPEEDRKKVIETFLKASILAVPTARRNSMLGHNPPAYVLGLIRQGQPVSLINAFESGVHPRSGYVKPSIDAMEQHYLALKQTYNLDAVEVRLPEKDLDSFCREVMANV